MGCGAVVSPQPPAPKAATPPRGGAGPGPAPPARAGLDAQGPSAAVQAAALTALHEAHQDSRFVKQAAEAALRPRRAGRRARAKARADGIARARTLPLKRPPPFCAGAPSSTPWPAQAGPATPTARFSIEGATSCERGAAGRGGDVKRQAWMAQCGVARGRAGRGGEAMGTSLRRRRHRGRRIGRCDTMPAGAGAAGPKHAPRPPSHSAGPPPSYRARPPHPAPHLRPRAASFSSTSALAASGTGGERMLL
jgi:hypothetical protein